MAANFTVGPSDLSGYGSRVRTGKHCIVMATMRGTRSSGAIERETAGRRPVNHLASVFDQIEGPDP